MAREGAGLRRGQMRAASKAQRPPAPRGVPVRFSPVHVHGFPSTRNHLFLEDGGALPRRARGRPALAALPPGPSRGDRARLSGRPTATWTRPEAAGRSSSGVEMAVSISRRLGKNIKW